MKFSDLFRRRTDRDRFAQSVIRRAKARGWPHEITYDRESFCLRTGATGGRFFLENSYNIWSKGNAVGRPGDIDQLVSMMLEGEHGSTDLEAVLPLLLPVVRNRCHLETQWLDPSLSFGRDWWAGAYQPLCDALAVGIAIDRPSSLALVDGRQLTVWDKPFPDLLKRAIENLRERSPAQFERESGGFYVSQYNDQYDCSRMLIPEIFDLLSLNGDPVAVPIAREGMAVAGSHDTAALIAMARFAEEQLEKAVRPTSYLPLVLKHGVWRVFSPSEPELEPLRDLAAKQSLWDYHEQGKLLRQHCEKNGRDVYVAKVEALKFDGRVYRWATWTQSLATLLPEVDAVVIYRDDQRPLMRTWSDLWAVCGDSFSNEQLYPVRYLTPAAIDTSRLEKLERGFGLPPWLPSPKDREQMFV